MDLFLRRYRSMVTVAELDWIVENTVTCDSRPNSFPRPLPSCYTCETSTVSSRNHLYHHGIIRFIKKSSVSSRKWWVRQHGRGRHHHGSGACGNTDAVGIITEAVRAATRTRSASSRKWCVRQHGSGRHHHGSGACSNTGELGHVSLQTPSTGLHPSSNPCHNSLRHKSPKTVS